MERAEAVDRGRAFVARQAWGDAYDLLSAVDREEPLNPEDLERLATVAHLIGKDVESADFRARAHHDFLERGDIQRAARCAFWLGFCLLTRGEHARGAGWISRAQRLVDTLEQECIEEGFLLVPVGLRHLGAGQPQKAEAIFSRAAALGERFENADLTTMGRLGRGQALIRMEKTGEGVQLLDEAMAAVEAEVVSPIVAGIVYCAVLEACQETYDMQRAREWTDAMSRWCESQPDLVPYRGQCLVRRAEIMQLHGDWEDALDEAQQASTRLSRPPGEPAAGVAFYRQAELHRLRGEFAQAEDAYRKASQWGRTPQPGLALLRLSQGRLDAATAAIRREAEEAKNGTQRARVLPAYVEIMLAAKELQAARAAADELSEAATKLDAPLLHAQTAYAEGAVLLDEKKAGAALDALRRSWATWNELEAPYEAARVRMLIGRACRALGDDDTAEMEFEAAHSTFQQLGAVPKLEQVHDLTRQNTSRDTHGLTPRQLQVLHAIAAGKTNKAIAGELFISERTVERHVSNIFDKLNVSSRAAATAYAYEHQLV